MPSTLSLFPSFPVAERRCPERALDLSRCVPAADWARLPEALRRRFAVRHAPARYTARMRFERSRVGGVFAVLLRPFGSPLPRVNGVELPVTVDVRAEGSGVSWSRRLGAAGVVRSVKSAGPGGTVLERTDGGLGMVLDVSVEAERLVFTSRSFFLAAGRWRVPVPGWLTPGRCRVEHRALKDGAVNDGAVDDGAVDDGAVDDERFLFTLSMTHPLWGTTFRQSGVFTTQEPTP